MSVWPGPTGVLLFGGGGLLGTALRPALEQAGLQVSAPSHAELDLLDLPALRRRIRELGCELIINCAAQSNVDQAERDPETAFRVNAVGAHNAALAAAEADLALMQISTDYVFDASSSVPRREYHPTGVPPSAYGQSKLQGELLVRATLPRHFIVRVAALFGEGRSHFVNWVRHSASPARPLRIVSDRFVSPTWTAPLARTLTALARTPFYGTYHAAGAGVASWYELARAVLELTGQDPAGVIPAGAAPRAPFTGLDNHLLRLRGLGDLPAWRDALSSYLAGRRLED